MKIYTAEQDHESDVPAGVVFDFEEVQVLGFVVGWTIAQGLLSRVDWRGPSLEQTDKTRKAVWRRLGNLAEDWGRGPQNERFIYGTGVPVIVDALSMAARIMPRAAAFADPVQEQQSTADLKWLGVAYRGRLAEIVMAVLPGEEARVN